MVMWNMSGYPTVTGVGSSTTNVGRCRAVCYRVYAAQQGISPWWAFCVYCAQLWATRKRSLAMRGDDSDPVRDLFHDANIPRVPRGVIGIGILVLLGIGILLSMFYTVEADEVAVVQ